MKFFGRSIRRMAVAAAVVLVLGGAAVGIAAAQAQPPTGTPTAQQTAYQKFIAALASHFGITPQAMEQEIANARQSAGLPAGNQFPGGPGRGGPRAGFALDLQAAATAIGISPQQLRTELPGSSLAQVAQAHGKSGAEVAAALKTAANNRFDDAVTAGRLTADQANTRKQQAAQHIDQLVNQVMPKGGPGPGPGGPGGPGGFGRGAMAAGLSTAAKELGITPQELRTELASGKSLAQVAQAHGKTGADVATALKDAANQRFVQAVASGRLTQDQANTMKTQVDQRIDQLVNQVMPQGGRGFGRGPSQTGTDGDQADTGA
jgi:uncharacterized protein YaiL (DUF2058 family)